jgi:hypothetical protein
LDTAESDNGQKATTTPGCCDEQVKGESNRYFRSIALLDTCLRTLRVCCSPYGDGSDAADTAQTPKTGRTRAAAHHGPVTPELLHPPAAATDAAAAAAARIGAAAKTAADAAAAGFVAARDKVNRKLHHAGAPPAGPVDSQEVYPAHMGDRLASDTGLAGGCRLRFGWLDRGGGGHPGIVYARYDTVYGGKQDAGSCNMNVGSLAFALGVVCTLALVLVDSKLHHAGAPPAGPTEGDAGISCSHGGQAGKRYRAGGCDGTLPRRDTTGSGEIPACSACTRLVRQRWQVLDLAAWSYASV